MNEDKNEASYYLISFKLSGEKLNRYYDTSISTSPWKRIEGFLSKAGFSRTKDSEYVSDRKMSTADAYQLLAKMVDKMPWIATSYDVFNMYSIKGEIKISEVIRQSDILHGKIKKLIDNPPGQTRGISSAKNPSAPSGKQQQPVPSMPPVQQKSETVTVSLSELKEYFEAGVEMEVTVKRSDLEAAKKQTESKQQKKSQTENPPEQGKAKKPKR